MWERCAKVGAVDGAVAVGFGGVDVFTSGTVEFDGFDVGCVAETDGEEGLLVAVDARAAAEIGTAVFFELERWSSVCVRDGERRYLTILARPLLVTINRAWIRPYRNRAEVSSPSRSSSSMLSSPSAGGKSVSTACRCCGYGDETRSGSMKRWVLPSSWLLRSVTLWQLVKSASMRQFIPLPTFKRPREPQRNRQVTSYPTVHPMSTARLWILVRNRSPRRPSRRPINLWFPFTSCIRPERDRQVAEHARAWLALGGRREADVEEVVHSLATTWSHPSSSSDLVPLPVLVSSGLLIRGRCPSVPRTVSCPSTTTVDS